MDFKKKKELTESELLMVEYQPLMYMNMEKFDQLGKMKFKRTMNKCINDILRPDTYIYGFGINGEKHELYLDIDYICRIVKRENYLFDIVPSTIVFVNVWDISIQLDTNENIIIDNVDVEYLGVPRNSEYVKSESEYKVSIECLQGMLSFCTIGGHLIKREQEVTIEKEHIEISSLRPICFSQEGEMQNIKLTNQVDRGGLWSTGRM